MTGEGSARTGEGWRPHVGAPVRWPDDFGTRYLLTVDTEEEFDWSAPFDRTSRSTTATAAIPAAHRRFADHGAAPVWLLDHPIASDPRAVDIIAATLADGRSAIGTQLHPWVNPPHDETLGERNSFPGNLPRALQAAKLDQLTDRIESGFGQRPIIYRAGRYGLGPDTLALLASRGYRFDTSMRAGYDFTAKGGPDYRGVGNAAFRADGGIVELPLTTVFTGLIGSADVYHAAARLPHGPGVLARTGLVERIALSPEDMPLPRALAAIRRAHRGGERLLVFSFHSPSLAVGHTPYVRNAADLAHFWAWWDGVFAELARLGIANASLGEVDVAVAGDPALG